MPLNENELTLKTLFFRHINISDTKTENMPQILDNVKSKTYQHYKKSTK